MKQPIAFDKLHSIVEPLVIEKESCEMEYKTALDGFPFSFWETYSSFANTNLEPTSATLEPVSATLEPASTTKMPFKQRREMILDFCSEWRTAEEIANFTHLGKNYLRNKYLTTMDDVLVRKFSTPHHPKQQYKRKQ